MPECCGKGPELPDDLSTAASPDRGATPLSISTQSTPDVTAHSMHLVSIGPELRAIEQELRATLRWGALYPGLAASRETGSRAARAPCIPHLGCALVLWILAWE